MSNGRERDVRHESWLNCFVRPVTGSNLPFEIGQVVRQYSSPAPAGIGETVLDIHKFEVRGDSRHPTGVVIYGVPARAVEKA
jgi:hypothetical protein